MFEPFEGVPDYPKLEQEILSFWDEFQVFNRLREQHERLFRAVFLFSCRINNGYSAWVDRASPVL
ncbi:MAG TPA: hypothetical protein VGB77_08600 [Abditibacteriaceae bacterium]|jgi:hypothetical protein